MHRTPRFNVALMSEDMSVKGWQAKDLAVRAGLVESTLSRFLNGKHQTPRTAKKIAVALGRSLERYLIREEALAR